MIIIKSLNKIVYEFTLLDSINLSKFINMKKFVNMKKSINLKKLIELTRKFFVNTLFFVVTRVKIKIVDFNVLIQINVKRYYN